jgi:hypothetical protein
VARAGPRGRPGPARTLAGAGTVAEQNVVGGRRAPRRARARTREARAPACARLSSFTIRVATRTLPARSPTMATWAGERPKLAASEAR